MSEDAYNRTLSDISKKRGTRTNEPVKIFYNPDNKQFLVEDGMHRIVEAHQNGETSVPAKIWSGYSDLIANVRPEDRMNLEPIKEEEAPTQAAEREGVPSLRRPAR